MDKKQNNIPNLKINFLDSASNVNYSNFALINNSSEEFLFDFGNITPGKEGIEIFSPATYTVILNISVPKLGPSLSF